MLFKHDITDAVNKLTQGISLLTQGASQVFIICIILGLQILMLPVNFLLKFYKKSPIS